MQLDLTSIESCKRIVIKIGSALLVDDAKGELRADWLNSLTVDIAELKKRGQDVILVSSGSIALGRGTLGSRVGRQSEGADAGRPGDVDARARYPERPGAAPAWKGVAAGARGEGGLVRPSANRGA